MNDGVQELAEKLQITIPKQLNSLAYGILAATNEGAFMARNILLNMHNQIIYAGEALLRSKSEEQLNYNGKPVIRENTEHLQDMYLQMAILSYNCCLDYVWECLYFYFDIGLVDYKHITNSKVEDHYRMVTRPVVKKIMIKLKIEHPNLYQTIKAYRTKRKHVNDLAIRIKHHGRFAMKHQQVTGFSAKRTVDGKEQDLLKLFEPEYLDRTREIDYLSDFHHQTFLLEKLLFETLDFSIKIKQKEETVKEH